jgi:tRNA (mo5U34)-methyltransferase
MSADQASELSRRVAELDWYHTMELAPGVVTPGWFDTRLVAPKVGLPASLEGMRCLDVGTYDGFWAFEMERRGAAEVVAIDVLDPMRWDWPVSSEAATASVMAERKAGGRGFEVARAAYGSRVERLDLSVYELGSADVGLFDLVYLGSLLLHLRDPIGALEQVCAVCSSTLIVVDAIDLALSLLSRAPAASLDGRGRPWWWKPNLAGLVRMVEAAGFETIGEPRRVYVPPGEAYELPAITPQRLLRRAGREAALISWRGEPHGVVVARPSRGAPSPAQSSG